LSYASVLVMPNLFIGSWEEAIGLALFWLLKGGDCVKL
jgi:hypothetical protein